MSRRWGGVRSFGLALAVTQSVVAQSAPQPAPAWRDPSPHQAQHPFEEVAARCDIRNDQERAALRQVYDATRTLYSGLATRSPCCDPHRANRRPARRQSLHVSLERSRRASRDPSVLGRPLALGP